MEQLVIVVVVSVSLQSGYNVSMMSYNLHLLHQSTTGLANWKPPRKKETKQSFPFTILFYLCFSFIRMCCISKPLGRYVTLPTCEKLHALISHIWVAFFAPSCTRALILLSICTDNTPPYRHNGVLPETFVFWEYTVRARWCVHVCCRSVWRGRNQLCACMDTCT